MQLSRSNLFTKKKLPFPIILSSHSNCIALTDLIDLSDDVLIANQESNSYEHYLNGKLVNKYDIFSGFDIGILNTERVLINLVTYKKGSEIYNDHYELSDTEVDIRSYFRIEKVLNVFISKTKLNLTDMQISSALHMIKAYSQITTGPIKSLITSLENMKDGIYGVLNDALDDSSENVYVIRGNKLEVLSARHNALEVEIDSLRVIIL